HSRRENRRARGCWRQGRTYSCGDGRDVEKPSLSGNHLNRRLTVSLRQAAPGNRCVTASKVLRARWIVVSSTRQSHFLLSDRSVHQRMGRSQLQTGPFSFKALAISLPQVGDPL